MFPPAAATLVSANTDLTRVANALGLTTIDAVSAPWDLVAATTDGRHVGLIAMPVASVTQDLLATLEASGQAAALAQGVVVIPEALTEDQQEALDLEAMAIPLVIATVSDLVRQRNSRNRTTILGTDAKDGLVGALAEVRRRILNLTTANVLISLKDTKLTLRLEGSDAVRVLRDLVKRSQCVSVAATDDQERPGRRMGDGSLVCGLSRASLDARLRTIEREFQDRIHSRGLNELYLAVGVLVWHESGEQEKPREAPLVLVPVTINRSRITRHELIPVGDPAYTRPGCTRQIDAFQYDLEASDEGLRGNPSLALKLEQQFDIALPDLNASLDEDGRDLDLAAYLESVQASVRSCPEASDWRVEPRVILGFFSYSKAVMEQDLDPKAWPGGIPGQRLLESVLIGGDAEAPCQVDDATVEAAHADPIHAPIDDCDSSQAKAMLIADQGRNLVIQGPPGTGKSQTITNLIAQALANGKRVLFLSEKQAALQVVQHRLARLGLGDFLLPLHDPRQGSKELLRLVGARIRLEPTPIPAFQRRVQETATTRHLLSHWAETVGRQVPGAGLTASGIFWATSHLRSQSEILRRDPIRGLATLIGRLRLDAPPSGLVQDMADAVFDDLAVHEASGLLDRCACWSGFLVRTLEAGDVQRIAPALHDAEAVLALLERQIADLAAQGWAGGDATLDEFRSTSRAMRQQAIPDPLHRPAVDRLVRILGGRMGDRGLPAAVRTDLQREQDRCATITATLGAMPDQIWIADALSLLDAVADDAIADQAPIAVLHALPDRVAADAAAVQALHTLADATATELGLPPIRDITAWERLVQILDLAAAAPAAVLSALDPVHAGPEFPAQVIALTAKITHLRDERAGLERLFAWDDIPPDEDLARLRTTLREGHGTMARWWPWSAYRTARSACRRFLIEPAVFTRDFPAIVNGLTALPRHRLAVRDLAADQSAAHGMGMLFVGMETDLDRLAQVRGLVSALAGCCSIAHHAALLDRLPAWCADRRRLEQIRVDLRRGLERHQDLVAAVGAVAGPSTRKPSDEIAAEIAWAGTLATVSAAARPFALLATLPAGARWMSCRNALRHVREVTALHESIRQGLQGLGLADDHRQAAADIDDAVACLRTLITLPSDWFAWILDADLPLIHGIDRAKSAAETMIGNLRTLDERVWPVFSGYLPEGVAWPALSANVAATRMVIRTCLERIDDLPGWARIVDAGRRTQCEPALATLIAAVLNRSPLLTVAEARLLWDWTRHEAMTISMLAADHHLRAFDRARHENRRGEFAKADRDLHQQAMLHIRAKLTRLVPPDGNGRGPVRTFTDRALLERECGKSTRHVPVRDLIHRAGTALQTLMPCWMMSPLSVSWFLPRNGFAFDLVVMDEASQIRPEDAIGALMRAKQVVVVGDNMQMPPSRTFDTGGNLEGIFAISQQESLLSLAESSRSFVKTRLTWHYRSRHQSLIAFSNARYYDNELLIFPSATRGTSAAEGITLVHLPEATYSHQRNQAEAEAVVLHIIAHARANLALPPEQRQSLGVAAMNAPQRDLILDLLETRCLVDPAVREAIDAVNDQSEPLFVQNLENVQGDERDHIIISFTYGPDPASRQIMQRFGPILLTGGERRLNVLFTRARVRITAITSLCSEAIKAAPTSPRGLRDLKAYLAYAETGSLPQEAKRTEASGRHDSMFEAEVAQALTRMGLRWDSQVGVAGYFVDLGVYDPEHPDRFLLGIECDGATYHSSRVARDRDRLREQVIRSRGWDIYRIWSSDWFHNRSLELSRLEQYLSRRLEICR